MSNELRITNGKIYDPANNIDGEIRDICIKDGRIVESVSKDAKTINAHGNVVMAGAVDIHCHIAGPKVNLARKLQPEDHRLDPHPATEHTRSGVGGVVPSTFATGYRYATLGYTTAFDAAVPPLAARHVLEELHDTPVIDKGYYAVLGNHIFLQQLIKEGRKEELKESIAWWLNACKGYTTKIVNPGGDEPWKGNKNSNVRDIDEKSDVFGVSPRDIINAFIDVADDLGLPHPPHVHCNNLGHSGNFETTIETMKTAGDRRLHLAHIQFHSYGGKLGENPLSAGREIVEYVNEHQNISCDVGQVMFGKSTIMTADAPSAHMTQAYTHTKWINADTENESGCGVAPYNYQEHVYTNALQWAVGLEIFLLSKDPWRIVFSTDSPNGASFTSYPKLVKLLMDKGYRDEEISRVNQKAMNKSILRELDREYTLNEIAIITRAGPAKCLGLANKGHLGIGADADITIYDEQEDKELMFNAPRYVIKSGHAVIADFEFTTDYYGKTLHIQPEYDPSIENSLRPFFDDYYSIRFNNYAVSDHYLHDHEFIPLRKS